MSILSLIPVIGDIIDKVIPDPQKKMELNYQLAQLADQENQREHEQMIAQAETNTAEAGHRSIFVAGWRPFVGWGCGAALIYNSLLAPAFGWGVADLAFLQTILMGMLGIGAMRSYDKAKGTSNDVLPILKGSKTTTTVITQVAPPVKVKKKGLDLWPF